MFEHSHPTIYGQVFVHGLLFVLNIVFHGCVCGWQLREAAILAIGTVAGSLHKAKVGLIPLVFWTHNHSKNLHFWSFGFFQLHNIAHTLSKLWLLNPSAVSQILNSDSLPQNLNIVTSLESPILLTSFLYSMVQEEGLLMFNFEPFLDSILNDDLRSAGIYLRWPCIQDALNPRF